MKRILILISLIIMAVFLTSCRSDVHITGLYQWTKHSDKECTTYTKSMLVTNNYNGTYNIILKDQEVPDNGDNVGSNEDTIAVINTKVKYGKIITVYNNTAYHRYKHQFIFQKSSVRWRYAKIEAFTEDPDFVKEKIKQKKYYNLKQYIIK